MFKSILLVSLLIAGVFAQYPNIPLQFTADVQVSMTANGMPMPGVSGTMYYDYLNQVQRIDSKDPFFGQQTTTLDRYDLGNEYSIAMGQCQCQKLTSAMQPYSVLPGSTNLGIENVNGVDCDSWQFEMMGGVTITNYVDHSNPTVLVSTNITINSQGQLIQTIMDFSNVKAGAPSPSYFVVPSACAGACPVPPKPTPPPASSCANGNNNPPSGCSCLSSPLTFCNLVNYPISSAESASMVDSMVQQTYNSFISASNPPANCASNVKSFLCATLFPLCVDGITPVLPCNALCPTCSCSGQSTGSCAAAPNGTSLCTQYGNSFC